MDSEWNDSQPIYRQLRDRVVAMILDGLLNEGDPLPSVRNVAAEYRVNPLTVLKAYQQLVGEELVETRRGLGMFVNAGARDLLLKARTAEVSYRSMARNRRNHSAAWDHTQGAFGCRQTEVRGQRPEIRSEAMKPALNHQPSTISGQLRIWQR